MEDEGQSLINRIVVFGVLQPESLCLSAVKSNKVKVGLISEIPTNKNNIDYEMWAYPDGIKIYNHQHEIINDLQPQFSFQPVGNIRGDRIPDSQPPQYIYSFVLTDYELNRTYCTCLSYNEKHFIANDNPSIQKSSLFLPKCPVSDLIDNPLALDSSVAMVYIPKAIILQSDHPCFAVQRALLKNYYAHIMKGKPIALNGGMINAFTGLIISYGYGEGEKKWEKKLNRVPGEEKEELKAMSIGGNKLQQFYLALMFLLPSKSQHLVLLTEDSQHITSLYRPRVPFKIPDQFQPHSLLTEAHPSILPLPIPSLITLWKCLLLEKQVLIFSESQAQTINLCSFLLYLLDPIAWQNIYIPFLPFHLSHHVDAIGGYLIGMSYIHMDYMIENFDLKSKVIVDLKSGIIIQEGGKENIELPLILMEYLSSNLGQIEKQISNLNKVPFLFNPKVKVQHSTPTNFIIKIQRIFFTGLYFLLNNFTSYIFQRQSKLISFDIQNFVKILPWEDHQEFVRELVKTMGFIRLCELCRKEEKAGSWVQKNLGELLVYCHGVMEVRGGICWTLQDLLNEKGKFYLYVNYIEQKCIQQINFHLSALKRYIWAQQKEQQNKKGRGKKKWKKYGEKDEEDWLQQADKYIYNFRVEKYLVKYIKYIELHQPNRLVYKKRERKKSETWLSWFWNLLANPSEEKEEDLNLNLQQKKSLKKMENNQLDLKCLFINMLLPISIPNSICESNQKQTDSPKFKRISQTHSQNLLPRRFQ